MYSKILMLCMFCCVFSQGILAGDKSYHCVISDQLLLAEDGSFDKLSDNTLVGKRFSIDRNTGYMTGPENTSLLLSGQKTTILAHGNADNSFVMDSVAPARAGGVHLTTVRVDEFKKSVKKPFLIVSGAYILSGLCE